MNDLPPRSLAGLRIGLSIAESERSADLGFNSDEVNRCVVQLASTLLGEGAGLVFGHDWRPGGIMDAIARIVPNYRRMTTDGDAEPLVVNYVPWPDQPALDESLRRQLHGLMEIRPAGLPREWAEAGLQHLGDPVLRAIGLTHMRRQITNECDVRICLGGRTETFSGWLPGIIEEAAMAFDQHKPQPVFASALLGGATARIIADPTSLHWVSPRKTDQMEKSPLWNRAANLLDEMRYVFAHPPFRLHHAKIPLNACLEPDDQRRLAEAREIDTVIVLILRGLHKLASTLPQSPEKQKSGLGSAEADDERSSSAEKSA